MSEKEPIRVLIVDDSSFMRKAIKGMIDDDPEIHVIDVARDGREAVQKVKELRPDVVTLDVEMPVMDGLSALRRIMEECPTPVLMLSSITEEGALCTFSALDLGAVDFIPKHLDDFSFNIFKIKKDITDKIKAAAKVRVRRHVPKEIPVVLEDKRVGAVTEEKFATQRVAIVAIGASTGGPRAVQEVLSSMPSGLPVAFLVVQHMPEAFTGAYADRLNQISHLSIKEASDGDKIQSGQVLIAPGGTQTKLYKESALEVRVKIEDSPEDSLYKPSVDISLASVAKCFPSRALGVILTGMGYDGAKGIKAIKDSGGKVLVQDEASCVVYGMPKAIVDEHLEDKIIPLSSMAGEIINMV
ncbi:MAG: chemotaxis response regulator protein-glutamate methylesterase [Thermodesulfobacteriota bacterium]